MILITLRTVAIDRMPICMSWGADVVNAQRHISSRANQGQKEEKGDGQGGCQSLQRHHRDLAAIAGFSGSVVSNEIMLYFMIAYFYISFEYYVNCPGRRIAAQMRRSGLKS